MPPLQVLLTIDYMMDWIIPVYPTCLWNYVETGSEQLSISYPAYDNERTQIPPWFFCEQPYSVNHSSVMPERDSANVTQQQVSHRNWWQQIGNLLMTRSLHFPPQNPLPPGIFLESLKTSITGKTLDFAVYIINTHIHKYISWSLSNGRQIWILIYKPNNHMKYATLPWKRRMV